MSENVEARKLIASQRWARVGVLVAMGLIALVLRAVDPTSLTWLPFRASCGAITGLPCVFCGTTRALHHLLNGHLGEALYFNWLAFPVALWAVGLWVKWTVEMIYCRRVSVGLPAFRFTPRLAVVSAVVLLTLWTVQVSLALALHKRQLLNPKGLLYGLVVR